MAKDLKNKKNFFKSFKAELKKVIWPTPKQLMNNTMAVVTIVLLTAIIVFLLDVVFEFMNNYGINKLKSSIKNKTVIENVIDVGENSENILNENEPSTENTENVE